MDGWRGDSPSSMGRKVGWDDSANAERVSAAFTISYEQVIFVVQVYFRSGAMIGKRWFSSNDYEVVECKALFQGFFSIVEYRLRHRLFGGGWSAVFSRELF